MTRLVEVLVAMSAICGIAGFLGVRAAVRKTLRTLGREPEHPRDFIEDEETTLLDDGAPPVGWPDKRQGVVGRLPHSDE